MSLNLPLLAYWYHALESSDGWFIPTPEPQRLISTLYSVRAKSNDPRLSKLSLQISRRNPTGEVWIVKNLGAR